ncbi:MAG: SGNH/GDSL hydrolase family protein [Solirubrobacterales bacterium]|nr:SGNH/GDSL hydrolase family protein [Solirubrobacterales bacterium]
MRMRIETSARRLATAATVLVCVVAATALGAACASARRAPVTSAPVTAGSGYLALGDSVSFGYQEPQVVPAPDYLKSSSFLGFPEQLASELHLTLANASCPGETSASLVNANAQSNGCENAARGMPPIAYRKLFPLHVSYTGSQLAFAVSYLRAHPGVRLVSLMIGANDAFVCQETTADKCASLLEQAALQSRISGNVRRILTAIRDTAHYRGQVAIVNYFSTDYASPTIDALSHALNRIQDTAAKPFHVVIADGYGEWQAATARAGGSSCTAGLLTQLRTGKCGIHPTYAGQALLAEALLKAIRVG